MTKFRIVELLERNPTHKEYFERMLKATLEGPRPPPVVPTKTQAHSTAMALAAQSLRDPSEDEAYWSRPINPDYLANPNAKNHDELTGKRELGIEEMILYTDYRHSPKNSMGTEDLTMQTPENRRRAVEAFTYSKPAELTKEELKRVTKLVPIESEKLDPVEPKPQGFWARLFGPKKHDDGVGFEHPYFKSKWK